MTNQAPDPIPDTRVDHIIFMNDTAPRMRNLTERRMEHTWVIVPATLDVQAGDVLWFCEPGSTSPNYSGVAEAVNSGEQGLQRGYVVVTMRMIPIERKKETK